MARVESIEEILKKARESVSCKIERSAVEEPGAKRWVLEERLKMHIKIRKRRAFEKTYDYLQQLIRVRKGLQKDVIYPD